MPKAASRFASSQPRVFQFAIALSKTGGRTRVFLHFQGADNFKAGIAPARTFGFLKDIAQLQNMGLANGGRLSNFILIDDEKIVNTTCVFRRLHATRSSTFSAISTCLADPSVARSRRT